MRNIGLTYAGELYDRTWALKDGSIKPRGIDLKYLVFGAREVFHRMLLRREFDCSEMSLCGHSMHVANDRDKGPFVAIPVFPSRVFRHGFIFINSSSKIMKPGDLEGKKVGLEDFTSTAMVWMRGLLQHEFGVDISKIRWVTRGRAVVSLPAGVSDNFRILSVPSTKSLDEMLESGRIDGMISPHLPSNFYSSRRVRRLFPNHRRLEIKYFKRTGIFPIMHTVVVRRKVYEKSRWIAKSLYDAFEQAKAACYNHMTETKFGISLYSIAWLMNYYEEERKILGKDPFCYGVKANRKVLDTFLDYAYEQFLLKRRPEREELFAAGLT